MNGWSSHLGADRWDDEPAWLYEITWEWEPVSGQRYPGDPGRRRRAVHVPVYEASRGDDRQGPEDQPPVRYVHTPTQDLEPTDDYQDRYRPRPAAAHQPSPPAHQSLPPGHHLVPPAHHSVPAAPPPVPRVDPTWNRPVPLPDRLPDRAPHGRHDDRGVEVADPRWAAPGQRPVPYQPGPDQQDVSTPAQARAVSRQPAPPQPRSAPPHQSFGAQARSGPALQPGPSQSGQSVSGSPQSGRSQPGIAPPSQGRSPLPARPQSPGRAPLPAGPPSSAGPQPPVFEQTRPVPQDVRPQFRDAPPPVQDMPAPFYGSIEPTLRDVRPGPGAAQPREPRPGDGPYREARPSSGAPPAAYGSARPIPPADPGPPAGPRPPRWETPEVYRAARPYLPESRPPESRPPASEPAAGSWSAEPTSGPAHYRPAAPASPYEPQARHAQGPLPPSQRPADPRATDPRSPAPRPTAPRSVDPRPTDPRQVDRPVDLRSIDAGLVDPRSPDPRSAHPFHPRREQSTEIQPAVRADWPEAPVTGPPAVPRETPHRELPRPDVSPWDRAYADPASTLAGPVSPGFDPSAEPVTAPPAMRSEDAVAELPQRSGYPRSRFDRIDPVTAPPVAGTFGVPTAPAPTSGPAQTAATAPVSPPAHTSHPAPPAAEPAPAQQQPPARPSWFDDPQPVSTPATAEPAAAQNDQAPLAGERRTDEITAPDPTPSQAFWTEPETAGTAPAGPVPAEPAPAQETSAQPVSAQPISAQPVSAQPISAQPISAQPISAQPSPVEPVPAPPVSAQPVSAQPVSAQPVSAPVSAPVSGHPTSSQPAADYTLFGEQATDPQPAELTSTYSVPDGADPVHSAAEQPLSDHPASEQRPGDEPFADHQASDQPSADEPASGQPAPAPSAAGDRPQEPAAAPPPPDQLRTADPEPAQPISAPPVPMPTGDTEIATPGRPGDDKPETAETIEPAAPTQGEDEDEHGLGWLLKMSGLGAETPESDSEATPVSGAPVEDAPADPDPDPEPVAAESPSEAEPAQDWFAPTTDARLERPESLRDTEAADADTRPADADTRPADAEPKPEPTAPVTTAPEPAATPEPRTVDRRRRLVDPEQVLAAYPWVLNPDTLREVISDPEELLAVRDRLTDKLEYAERDAVRARLLSLRAVVSRVLGDLDFALADGREAVRHAEATGELRRTAITKARLAHVLRWRNEFAEADRLFEEANSVELPNRLRAEMYELAGRSAFDQGRFLEAMNRFEQALDLRKGEDQEMVARIESALDTVQAKMRKTGFGPYARSVDEILQRPTPPPLPDADRYAEVQPFAEQAAWIRRGDSPAWELIGGGGQWLVGRSSGYLQVRPFSEGLSWVSRDRVGGFFAIDHQNRLIVPGGFDDVGPFRHGVAPVLRGGWGAIDRHGRIVVQPKYYRFATTLVGGRAVDGFTQEGLAVVDAGDRLGVVDVSGQLLVAPVHAALVIHPVAFLIADRHGRWGALDRNGDPLIDVVHRSEADVALEMDRMLADTRPVL